MITIERSLSTSTNYASPPTIISMQNTETLQKGNIVIEMCPHILCNIGGILFIIGSIAYINSLQWSPFVGSLTFIIGSAAYFIADVINMFIHQKIQSWSLYHNIQSVRSLFSILGNFSFIIGSIFFLPQLNQIVGNQIFLVGCVIFCVPLSIISFDGLFVMRKYSVSFYLKNQNNKFKWCLSIAAYFLGSLQFIIGSILININDYTTRSESAVAVNLWIVGSFMFFISAFINGLMFLSTIQQHKSQSLLELQ